MTSAISIFANYFDSYVRTYQRIDDKADQEREAGEFMLPRSFSVGTINTINQ